MSRPKSPNPKSRQILVRFSATEHDALRHMAETAGLSLPEMCRALVLRLLHSNKRDK